MKKLITMILLMISMMSFSQIDYPKYEKDSLGNTIVCFTMEQAQKINSDSDLLKLLIKSNSQMDSLDIKYIKVIDNLNNQVSLLTLDVSKLKLQSSDKDSQILLLKKDILTNEKDIKLCEEQKTNDSKAIDILKDEVKKQKRQKVIGYVVGALATIGSVFLLIRK